MDPSRAAELTDLVQRLDAGIPIKPKLLILVNQSLAHISTGQAGNLERLEFLGDAVLRLAATEALIGALCSALGNFEAIHRWLTPLVCNRLSGAVHFLPDVALTTS